MRYDEYVPIEKEARGIPLHAFIDQCNARIIMRLLEAIDIAQPVKVLDVGAGTGQVSRLLLGLPNVEPSACDVSDRVQAYFQHHPELSVVPFSKADFTTGVMKATYNATIARGVLHHIPKQNRPAFLRNMVRVAPVAIVADEGIGPYSTEAERIANCTKWYQTVIARARKMGLPELVAMETRFMKNERKSHAEDGLDFKEGEQQFRDDASAAGANVLHFDHLGNWKEHGGGFYVAVLSRV